MTNIFAPLLASISRTAGERLGFRFGDRGTQSSRTIMLEELQSLLDAVPGHVERSNYRRAVLEDNCLGKRTAANRKLSFQRLSELYGLDPEVPLFRIMRDLWSINRTSRPLLALLLALARDPLLRMTAAPVLEIPFGREFVRQEITDAMSGDMGGRFNDSILDKIVRNASSSWTQSGHLQGRTRKFRKQAGATPVNCAYALLLAFLLGQRGQLLFESPWARVLDLEATEVLELTNDAKRLGLLDLKQSGSIIDVSFPQLLSSKDRELIHGAN